MSKEKSSSGGIGFAGLLCIVFITLKLIGVSQVANWSWWWVLSPIWISVALAIAIVIIYLIVRLIFD